MKKVNYCLNVALIITLIANIFLSALTGNIGALIAWVVATSMFYHAYSLEKKYKIYE